MADLALEKLVVDGDDPSMCRYLLNGDKTAPTWSSPSTPLPA
jgi:hypothetical protein